MSLLADRTRALLDRIAGLQRVVVAYSGGIDSTLVLAAAVRALGPEGALGVIGVSPALAARELEGALDVGRELGARVERLDTHELDVAGYRQNGPDRCYFCKTELYSALARFVKERGYRHILDGTNADDRLDLRPGRRAAEELGVVSPLMDAGLGKEDIRQLAREWNIRTWRKPASPCLSSRIPHFAEVTVEKLAAVEQAEDYLGGLGFSEFRVRHHGDVARLELRPGDRARVLEPGVREQVAARLKELGFRYVTLDLEDFRSGSLSNVSRKS